MQFVNPYSPTILFLTREHLPYMCSTAKSAFYSLLKGTGVGLDELGNRVTFETMRTGQVYNPDDKPALRSASHTWVLPTMVVSFNKAFYSPQKRKGDDGLPSIKQVYDYFDGVCQHCRKRVKWRDANRSEQASRDHMLPVASNGRIDHRSNILLMHASCNAALGHSSPKYDIDGNELTQGMRPGASHYTLPDGVKARPEWLQVAPWIEQRVKHLDLTKEDL